MTGLLITLVVLVALMLCLLAAALAVMAFMAWHDRRHDADERRRQMRHAERRAAENGRPHSLGVTQRATPREYE